MSSTPKTIQIVLPIGEPHGIRTTAGRLPSPSIRVIPIRLSATIDPATPVARAACVMRNGKDHKSQVIGSVHKRKRKPLQDNPSLRLGSRDGPHRRADAVSPVAIPSGRREQRSRRCGPDSRPGRGAKVWLRGGSWRGGRRCREGLGGALGGTPLTAALSLPREAGSVTGQFPRFLIGVAPPFSPVPRRSLSIQRCIPRYC